jgi:hypothetical protein
VETTVISRSSVKESRDALVATLFRLGAPASPMADHFDFFLLFALLLDPGLTLKSR